MAVPEDRMNRWRERRTQRMRSRPWVGSVSSGGHQAWYVRGEMLVVAQARDAAEAALADAGYHPADISTDEPVAGVHRYRVADLDVIGTVAAVHRRAGTTAAAAPNHIFTGAPINQGGPYGPPVPADAAVLQAKPEGTAIQVAVVDTGIWRDSPVPEAFFRSGAVDYEVATDVDHDGVLDGDVGHANFIAGVLIAHATNLEVSVTRVLDTAGMCTEAQLIAALAGLDDAVQVVNLSLGGYTVDDQPPLGLRAALAQVLAGRDRVLVAAAGNDGNAAEPFWPAAFAGTAAPWAAQVVAVAAHDTSGICPWSNTGPWVSLAAPGTDVDSTFIHHEAFPSGWARWNGTSFAAPRVAAAIVAAMADGGSALAALGAVRAQAAGHAYGGYPGLP